MKKKPWQVRITLIDSAKTRIVNYATREAAERAAGFWNTQRGAVHGAPFIARVVYRPVP